MYRKIVEKLKNKKIAILGFGKEGRSTYSFIRKYMPEKHITVLDLLEIKDDILFENDSNVTIISGKNYMDDLSHYDLVMKSPGISLKDLADEGVRSKITSQLELLLEVNSRNIIGITGTKGKSTTSSLLYEVFKQQGRDVYLLGNIGIPVLDKIEEYNENSILVIEMSSHQLEFVNVSPHIGIILNLFQDHLDHDGNLERYHLNKMNMFKFQNEDDIALYDDANPYLQKLVKNGKYKSIFYDIRMDDTVGDEHSIRFRDNCVYFNQECIYIDGERKLLGQHNLKNIMFVLAVAKIFDLDMSITKKTIESFRGLKYRMECIGNVKGVTYYNDTIATIPEATISAIESLKIVDTLIFGGMDRKIDYLDFIEYLRNSSVRNLICMPTTGFIIGKILEGSCNKNVFMVQTLEEAYQVSKKYTEKNKICLLSPAAASYEFYKNFEEKGAAFEKLIRDDL